MLQITRNQTCGVPFGQDRLVPIFLATLAMQQKSQTIRFRTAAEMPESFGMHTGGKEYRRLVGAFERIFGATIFFGTDSFKGKATMIQRSRFNFMREAQIWYSRDHPDQRTLFGDFGLASQIGTTDYSRPRRFRAMVEQWLGAIRVLWPECPARLSSDGQAITIRHAVAVLPTQGA